MRHASATPQETATTTDPEHEGGEHVRRRAWLLFLAASVIGGMPYLLIKVALTDYPPATVVWLRCLVATLALGALSLRRSLLRWLRHQWRAASLLALVQITVPFLAIAAGEQRVTSSLAGLLIATEPLFVVALLRCLAPSERVAPGQIAGMLLGVLGVSALVSTGGGDPSSTLVGVTLLLTGSFGYALGVVLLKRHFAEVPPHELATVTLGLNVLLLAPLGASAAVTRAPAWTTAAAVLSLGLVCTAVAFLVYYALVPAAGAARAAVVTYLNPAVAVLLGALFLDEHVSLMTVTGFLLVVTGCWLATRRWGRNRTEGLAPAPGTGRGEHTGHRRE
ncbi:DMT family transporter [Streptomyces sp. NPDC059009]|uniref:DMT family transporter n=1 Tax=Streptomyces sp. NPDC059009 TaxID=3346694 RepID=UPI003678852F